jgi:hypothetical protein
MACHTWTHPLHDQLAQALREGSEARLEDAVASYLGNLNVYVARLNLLRCQTSTLEVILYTYETVTEETCEQLHLFTELLQDVSGRAARVQLLTVSRQFFSRDFQFASATASNVPDGDCVS